MKCCACGGTALATAGAVRMTRKDGSPIIFTEVPLNQCQQCGEQYLSGQCAETIGELLARGDASVPHEVVAVSMVTVRGGS